MTLKKLFKKAFAYSVPSKSRMHWVDYLKGIAILMVVYRHVLLGIEKSQVAIPQELMTANMIFYSFRMPLFFILSGMFITSSLAKRTVKKLVGIKFENLLYPYLIWAFIHVSLQVLMGGFTNSDRGLKDYGFILYQPRALDQFWYLPALFNTTMVYLLVKTWLKPRAWMQLTLGLVFYFLSNYFESISMISDWMEFYFFFALGDAIAGFFFRDKTQNFLRLPWLALLAIPIFAVTQIFYLKNGEEYYSDDPVGKAWFLLIALIGCVSMYLLALRFQIWKVFSFLRVLGFHSIHIYVMHVIIAAFVRVVLTKVFHLTNPIALLLIAIAFAVTIPIAFYNLLVKDGPLWFLFSYKKSKTRSGVPRDPAPQQEAPAAAALRV